MQNVHIFLFIGQHLPLYSSIDDINKLDFDEETKRPTQMIQKIFTLHNDEYTEFETFIHEEPIDLTNPASVVSFNCPTFPE